jgi:formate-dependent nitrite reductase membrane component NrfD
MIHNAFKGSRRYWALLAVWAVLILIGTVAYGRQLTEGLYITGMNRDISWGLYIAQFTFMVGVAASAVMVVLPYYLHDYKAFGRIVILGEFLAVSSVLVCMLFVFVDMGQPTRVMNVLLHPTPNSVMFWDFMVLGGYLGLNLVIGMVTIEAERKDMPPPGWVRPLIYLSIPWAVSIHTVTAFLYAGLGARPFWMTAILAPRFLASAFAAGPSLLILLALIVRRFGGFDVGKEAIRALGTIVAYAMAINLFFVLVELFTALYADMPHTMDLGWQHHRCRLYRVAAVSGLAPSGTVPGAAVRRCHHLPLDREGILPRGDRLHPVTSGKHHGLRTDGAGNRDHGRRLRDRWVRAYCPVQSRAECQKGTTTGLTSIVAARPSWPATRRRLWQSQAATVPRCWMSLKRGRGPVS